MGRFLYKYRKAILLSFLVVYLSFIILSLNKPFVLNEAENVCMAQSINEFGIKSALRYEKILKCTDIYKQINKEASTFHTPVYLILLAFSFRVFGVSEVSARIVPSIFAIITLFLVYFLSLNIFKNNKKKYAISLLASFLYSINPLLVQGSTVPFADPVTTLFPVILSFYIFIKLYPSKKRHLVPVLGTVIFMLFWTKIQVPALFSSSVFLYLLLNKDFKSLLKLVLAVLIGSVIFFISWFLFSLEFQTPFMQIISHNTSVFGASAKPLLYGLLLRGWNIKNIIFWVTPGFFILFCIAAYKRINNYLFIKKAGYIDLLAIYCLVVSLFFIFFHGGIYGFPIFSYTVIPLAAIVISHFLLESKICYNKKLVYISVCFIILLLIFNIYILRDPFVQHNLFYTNPMDVGTELGPYIDSSLNGIWYLVPLLFGFLLFRLFRYKPINALIIAAVITLITACFYINWIQASADYSVPLAYGQEGLMEAANYINRNTQEGDIIISRQDIAYYADRSFITSYPVSEQGLIDIANAIETTDIPYIVLSSSGKLPNTQNKYYLEAEFGNFKIFKKIKRIN